MPLIRKDAANPPPAAAPNGAGDLKSPDSEMRWSAARQLGQAPSNVAVLADALAVEADPRVREALFTSLTHIQTPEALKVILPYIRSPDAAVRSAALDALNAVPHAVESELPTLLADPDPDVRLLVCDIVRRLPGRTATQFLCALLERESMVNVCGAAVDALSEVGDESALPVLAACAARFDAEPFLVFSIKLASSRIAGDGRARGAKAP